MELRVGLRAEIRHRVSRADTAAEVGSGDVPVLATPRLLALAEAATVAAVAAALGETDTSVGTAVRLDHLAASPVGADVAVEATLVEVDGRRLAFAVTAREGDRTVATGRVTRTVVDRARFLARVADSGSR